MHDAAGRGANTVKWRDDGNEVSENGDYRSDRPSPENQGSIKEQPSARWKVAVSGRSLVGS
ncbi:hypothetical protein PHYSODRAFT_328662 [Phytophthora sojae]|uniref:Uncharacterized protein n=1 Tax=Phytophthora sojae (strain P6497) TaxID=1094619 RepID=G4ZA09_PHYSP|nr:hypothetical protein PHYSODRAFT_328662 [Phytophthora sojae]EGZ20558.1 hypothetical protein PHYSODRAFT_328662 [Phytophthora sojae]|eukprot:XP_009523275.1 hypothetical protein PHYSODRAFT_328662 [Phytophthora sojae]